MVGGVVQLVLLLQELWRRSEEPGEALPGPEAVHHPQRQQLLLCWLPEAVPALSTAALSQVHGELQAAPVFPVQCQSLWKKILPVDPSLPCRLHQHLQ